jgi:hypothetical protein
MPEKTPQNKHIINVRVANSQISRSAKLFLIRNTVSYAAKKLMKEGLSLKISTKRLSLNLVFASYL